MKTLSRKRRDIPILVFLIVTVVAGHVFAVRQIDAQSGELNNTSSAVAGYSTMNPDDPVERVTGLLRSFGSSQLAYASFYTSGRYGTLSELKLAGFVDEGLDAEVEAPGYDIGWYRNERRSNFTLVALPEGDDEGGEGYIIDARQVVMRITPVSENATGVDFTYLIGSIEGTASGNDQMYYDWVEIPTTEVPNKEFDVLLTPDTSLYAVTWAATFVDVEVRTGRFIPEYVYLRVTDSYYSLEPYDEIQYHPMF